MSYLRSFLCKLSVLFFSFCYDRRSILIEKNVIHKFYSTRTALFVKQGAVLLIQMSPAQSDGSGCTRRHEKASQMSYLRSFLLSWKRELNTQPCAVFKATISNARSFLFDFSISQSFEFVKRFFTSK